MEVVMRRKIDTEVTNYNVNKLEFIYYLNLVYINSLRLFN